MIAMGGAGSRPRENAIFRVAVTSVIAVLCLAHEPSMCEELTKAKITKVKFDETFDLRKLRRIAIYPVIPITHTGGYKKMWLPKPPPQAIQDSVALSVAEKIAAAITARDSTRETVILPLPAKKTSEKDLIRMARDSAKADAVIIARYVWATSRGKTETVAVPSLAGSSPMITHGSPGYTEVHLELSCHDAIAEDFIWKAVSEIRIEAEENERPRGLEVPMTIAVDSAVARMPF